MTRHGAAGPTTDLFDAVVIGGGIAGLTAAWRLRHRRILLLESEDRVGGRMRSEPHGDYWLNYGAHLLPAPGSLVDSLVTELGLASVPVWGSMMALAVDDKMLTTGRVESYPLRLPIPIRDRAAFARQGLRIRRAVRDYARVARVRPGETPEERRRRVLSHLDDRTFADMLGPMPPSVEEILSCAAHRATAELDELSAGCGVGLFALVWGGKGSLIARNLLGGTGRLPEQLAAGLGDRVRTSAPVRAIASTGGLELEVTFDGGKGASVARARQVIVATPAPVASRLVSELAPEAGAALSRMRYGPFLSVAVATNEPGAMPWDSIYAMATPGKPFDMFTNQAHALRARGPRQRGGSLMLFAGGHGAADLSARSDDEIVARFIDGLDDLFQGAARFVAEARVHRWPLGNVFAQPGRRHLQEPIEGALGPSRNIHLAGDYFAELGNLEMAAQTGADAALRVEHQLRAGAVDLTLTPQPEGTRT